MLRSPSRRVVITGLGLISPLGNSPEVLWDALTSGRSGVRRLRSLPTNHLPTAHGAEAVDFAGRIEDFGPLEKEQKRSIRKGVKVMCREIQMGVAAAQLALANAGLSPGSYDPDRTGVVYGSDFIMTVPEELLEGVRRCLGAHREFQYGRWAEEGLPKVTPLWLLKYLPNMAASHIAIYNDLRGPSNSITLREASPNLAIGEAYWTIARGSADTIVAGATGTRVHPLRILHVLLQEEVAADSSEPARMSRPFDLHRTGMVVGEGAGALVLEELQIAQARGARVFGEVIGSASSTVADRRGVASCHLAVRNALVRTLHSADLTPDDVGHVHAHGLATRKCDAEEAAAIHELFHERRLPVPVVAGGGAVELIASLLALQHGRLFPVLNYETPDPQCPIFVTRSDGADPGCSFVNINVTPQGQAAVVAVRSLA
jgi:3-oxoacyl-[acyl-carrier-protein] synthase II